ncbi:hypothetical protein D3C76_1296190 [compost metagenome]
MGRINQQGDAFGANKRSQTFSTAITTDTHLAGKVGGHPPEARQAVDMLRPQSAGDGQGFGDATE